MLVAEITALSLAIITFLSRGKLLNNTGKKAAGPNFLILTFLLALVIKVSSILDFDYSQNYYKFVVWILLAMAFLLFDTQFIIDGLYVDITEDDYVFASMKLFADFVLIFQRIFQAC